MQGHDINIALWFTGPVQPKSVLAHGAISLPGSVAVDNVYSILDYGDKTITIETTRWSPDGYDQRVEVLSVNQKEKVEYDKGKNPYSFPQRYEKAFINQIEDFGKLLTG